MNILLPFARVLACLIILTIVGCAQNVRIKSITKPTAQIERVAVVDVTDQGVRLDFFVTLDNPNDDPLPLTLARYEAAVGSLGAYTGNIVPDVTIPGHGQQSVRLPVVLATPAGGSVHNMHWSLSGAIEYMPPGQIRELLNDMSFPRPTTNVSGNGIIGDAP
ncbi:MAG: hypothetical protein CMJ49_07455 [Planctomycetaceae bacterium]|nr:hypothetical protein [Planctomycetaceae bacterium]